MIQIRIDEFFKTTSDLVLRQYNYRVESVTQNEKDIKDE